MRSVNLPDDAWQLAFARAFRHAGAMQALAPYLVHVAAMFTLFCYLFRDQIKLRIFAAIGDTLLIAYYFFGFAEPLWNPLVWSVLNVVINVVMILIILRDAREHDMSDEELSLFRSLDTLTPGQFRKLVGKGTWHRALLPQTLTEEGEELKTLHYVLDGSITIDKANRKFPRGAKKIHRRTGLSAQTASNCDGEGIG